MRTTPILLAVLLLVISVGLIGQAPTPPVVTGNARVDRLLAQMTLEEKINLIHGGPEAQPSGIGGAGQWPGLPRLNIPSLRLTDGPPGISLNVWSTGMTATMGLAATWSRETAKRNGIVIARDAKAMGQDVVLQPFVNITRDFTFSRGHNTFGEDPYLSGQMAAAQIAGTQGEGIMSQIKHFVAYDGGNDVEVDQQTLREIYIAPFVDSIAIGVSSVMCSYNKINGLYACGNGEVMNKIYRGEDGFKGFNTSDWGGTHGTLNINEGLDLEMPSGTFFGATPGAARGGMGGGAMPGGAAQANPGGMQAGAPGAAGRGGAATPGGAAGRGGAALPGGAAQANPGGMPGGGAAMGGPGAVAGGMPEERALTPGAGAGGRGGGGRGGDPPSIGMLEAVKQGLVKESTISMAVGRILVQMDKFGMLDGKQKHTVTPADHAFNAPVVQKTGEDAATLLKNDGNALPITTADLDSTAFIGPTGGILVSIGISGERASGIPDHQVGPVRALEKIAGRKVVYVPGNDFDGVPIPPSAFGGVLQRTVTGSGQTQADADLNFTVSNGRALPPGTSYTWTGNLYVPSGGTYTIALQSRGTAASMTIDGVAMGGGGGRGFGGGGRGGAASGPPPVFPPEINALRGAHPISGNITPTADHLNNSRVRLELTSGAHPIAVTTTGETFGNPVQVRLAWVPPQQEKANYDAAIKAARENKKAVVFAWGRDRPEVFQLPGGQNQFISDIADANPNTIVVLNTTLPVEMPWLPKVKAVLQMWYPGDEGGPATANVLLGKVSPAGRLPITWPERHDQMVGQDRANHPERTNQGVNGKTTYSEGIYVGYRWFDKQDLKPLFPFGYGLSYAAFQYSGLKVARADDGGLNVSVTIKNTGKMAADEVPQVYLGAPKTPPAGPMFAVRALAQFDRVTIPAGQSKSVAMHVEPRRLQYWSTAANKWQTATGPRTVYVGASSRDVRAQADINIPR
jgi:beta-glucosidase